MPSFHLSDTRRRLGAAGSRWSSACPVGVMVAAFVIGLLLGWWVLGWWLFPVQWTDALPADLAEPWLQTYVQLVADSYADHGNVTLARQQLDGISAAALASAASAIVAADPGSASAANVQRLAGALQVDLAAGVTPTAAAAPAGLTQLARTLRTLLLLLMAALLAMGLTLWWASTHWRTARPEGEGAPAVAAAEPNQGLGPPGGRPRGVGAPPWRPARIDLGTTVSARFEALDERFFETWLVYDERGGLVGGAGLQAQPVGSVNTLVLWLRARYDDDETTTAPRVTIISRAAYDDTVLRKRLGDRNVIPAAPGQMVSLETMDLALDVQIRTVDPPPDRDEFNLRSIGLSLTPHLVAGPDDVTQEPEPPVPLPFRRD